MEQQGKIETTMLYINIPNIRKWGYEGPLGMKVFKEGVALGFNTLTLEIRRASSGGIGGHPIFQPTLSPRTQARQRHWYNS